MNYSLTVKGVNRTPALEQLLEHKLHFALDQFGHWLHDVSVAIEDLNGPKGGVDKRCRMTVAVPRHPGVVVEGRGDDLASVVTEVIDRAALALSRLRDRRHTRRRDPSTGTTP